MRYGWVVADYVRDGLEAVPAGTWVAFLTLTEPAVFRSVEDHAVACGRFLGDLWRLQAKERGEKVREARTLPYVGVREWQRRGAVHTHLLIAGWSKMAMADLRALAEKHGFGRTNVKAYRVEDGGSAGDVAKLSAYFAKTFGTYLTKSSRSEQLWREVCDRLPPGYRLVIHSKSWVPEQTLLTYGVRRRQESLARRIQASPVSSALAGMKAQRETLEAAERAVVQVTGVPVFSGDAVWYDEPNGATVHLRIATRPSHSDRETLPLLQDLTPGSGRILRSRTEQLELAPPTKTGPPAICRGTRLRIESELGPCPSPRCQAAGECHHSPPSPPR